jgi:hypothetical protein
LAVFVFIKIVSGSKTTAVALPIEVKKYLKIHMTKHIKPEKYIKDRGRTLTIKACYLNTDWQQTGKATILIVKNIPRTNYIIGSYEIDLWCLGIKQTSWGYGINEKKLDVIYTKLSSGKPFAEADYDLCCQLINEANAYALSIGLTTPPNFEVSQYLIDEAKEYPTKIAFGKNGKPHYVKSEFADNETIIKALTEKLGPDGFSVE